MLNVRVTTGSQEYYSRPRAEFPRKMVRQMNVSECICYVRETNTQNFYRPNSCVWHFRNLKRV